MKQYEFWQQPRQLLLLRGWARDGVPEREIARRMGLKPMGLRVWRRRYRAIGEALALTGEMADYQVEDALLPRLCADVDLLYKRIEALKAVIAADRDGDALAAAAYEHDAVIPAMNAVRAVADELETLVDEKFWPFPTYGDLLFRV